MSKLYRVTQPTVHQPVNPDRPSEGTEHIGGFMGAIRVDREGIVFKASPRLAHLIGTPFKTARNGLEANDYSVKPVGGRRS